MARGKKDRSLLAAEASRRNGALGKGPRTPSGKAASSRNAVTHGLFSAAPPHAALPVSPLLAQALASLGEAAQHTGEVELAGLADWRLCHATLLLAELDARIDDLAFAEVSAPDMLTSLLAQRARIGRYQHRFRGQRDRALRTMKKQTGMKQTGMKLAGGRNSEP
jgi:hypothetical protein